MTQKELKARLKGDELGGVYIFAGEEEYLKRFYTEELRKRILTEPAFEPFNHLCCEGSTIDFDLLLDAVKSPPMMADFKLIEWDRADFESMKEEALDAFASLTELVKEHPYAVLLFRATVTELNPGTAKRPSSLYKRLSELAVTVTFETATDTQLLGWLNSHFAHEGLSATAEALRLMLSRVGHSMEILASELDKLACYCRVHKLAVVTPELVTLVCSSTAEDDAFGLSNALLSGNRAAAYACLYDLRRRRVEPMLVLGQLTRLFTDLTAVSLLLAEGGSVSTVASALSMNEYKAGLYVKGARARSDAALRRAISICRDADLAVKAGADPHVRLDRMIAELL